MLTVTGTTSGKRIYISALTVYYEDGNGGGSSTLDDCDLALTNSPIALSFDLYNNADAQVINYTTSSTGAVSVSESEYVETEVNEDAKTITVTPKKKTKGEQTITVSQAADENYKAGSTTFTVTISDSTPKTGGWVKTDLADLAEGDVFVIVGNNGSNYAMSNDNGASAAPTAVAVTVEDDEITSEVEDNVKWNISYNSNDATYTFYPNGSTTTWLYCTNTNNGVRVGTNSNKSFRKSTENVGYLINSETSRYIGIYESQDWRCYGTVNSNITGQTFAFYKYDDNATVKKPVITVPETFIGSTTATITCGTDGATIYYSYDNATWIEYTTALTITETTTIYAKAVKDGNESEVVHKTTTKTLATPTVTIDATGIMNTNVYEGTAAGTLTATVTYNDAAVESAAVAWSGNNDAVATIDATTGVVTLVAAGSVTFTATFAGNADYNEATATYKMTVTNSDPNGPGTENNPYTVVEAIAFINTLGTSTSTNKVYVHGIISKVDDYNNLYGSITYWISDDGTTADQMQVYSGKGLNGANFSSVKDLSVGDIVTVKGNVKMYNGTPEFDKNNELVSLSHVEKPVINAENVELAYDATSGEIGYTISNPVDGQNLTAVSTAEWISNIAVTADKVTFTTTANEGNTARTATITLSYEGANDKDVTVTQAKYVAPDVPVDPAKAGVGAFVKVTSTADITAGNYLIVAEDFGVAFDGSRDEDNMDKVENIITVAIVDDKIASTSATVAATFTIQPSGSLKSASGVYIGKAANSNGLDTDDEEALPNTFAIDDNGNAVITSKGNCTLRYNKASDQKRFRYYKSGQQPIQLYKYDATATIPTVAVTVSDAGYATYCSTSNLYFGAVEGLTAYKATVSGTQVSFSEVEKVPASEGVLLKAEAGTYDVPVIESAAALTDNAFIGVTEVTPDVPAGIFVLLKGDKGVGFYKTNNAFTVGANTAYLPALESARSFIGLDEATAIDGIAAETMANGEVYNLQGQRVMKAQKGLYIMDGKKVLVK